MTENVPLELFGFFFFFCFPVSFSKKVVRRSYFKGKHLFFYFSVVLYVPIMLHSDILMKFRAALINMRSGRIRERTVYMFTCIFTVGAHCFVAYSYSSCN